MGAPEEHPILEEFRIAFFVLKLNKVFGVLIAMGFGL